MKVKVVKGFKDKYTKRRYQPGEKIEVTEERAKEILKVGELIEIQKDADEDGEEVPQDNTAKKTTTRKKAEKAND